jgi:hypothetical protein
MKTTTKKTITTKTKPPITSLNDLNKTEQEDLCAMVRIGRLANVIAFTRRAFLDADNLNRRLKDRQQLQGTFLLGGYLYEVSCMLRDMLEPYGMQAYFSDLLILKDFLQKRHEILTAFNFSPAFHQDWQASRTLRDLEKNTICVASLQLDCYLGENPGHLHFRQVIDFDTHNVIDDLLGPYDVEQLTSFMADEIHELSDAFLRGANSFIDGLSKKLLQNRRKPSELKRFKAE